MIKYTTILSDASLCLRTMGGGYGWWIASDRGSKLGGGGSFRNTLDTINAAEAMAAVNALYVAINRQLVQRTDHVLFQLDSVAAIGNLDGSRRKGRLSQDEKKAREQFMAMVGQFDLTVEFRHVKAHSGVQDNRSAANRHCDRHAKQGMIAARERLDASVGQ